MHVEITPRQFSIRVYDDHSDTDYIASAQLFSHGDKCSMYSVHGKGFYSALPEIIEGIESLGIFEIEAYMTPAHARLCRIMLKKFNSSWTINECEKGNMFGHNLIWVRLKNAKS